MLMPNKDRLAIFEYLFKEGVMVAEKDFHPKRFHPALGKVTNLFVIRALQSLKSKGYVKEQFSWRHYYWYLTNEGINYLREYLHLPAEIVPSTLKRPVKPEGAQRRDKLEDGGPPRAGGGRDSYRRDDGYRPGYGRGSNFNKPPPTQ
ncbi:PREDICTED: 40S ribosomal protein S10-like [Rhagoletis zephyria]|uniref:40S ribosomal protein S10-like n=1 Tax=Rhagoletis zephyria TaxID=28612 RepID=UPI0008119E2C|nr:PREDICTED: 40S ribosomal protein S10-like [Rhagoletis zephyria]KAH9397243.1 ribosomal 40S subunit protein S10A [Tyrophagus putrescentiae]